MSWNHSAKGRQDNNEHPHNFHESKVYDWTCGKWLISPSTQYKVTWNGTGFLNPLLWFSIEFYMYENCGIILGRHDVT